MSESKPVAPTEVALVPTLSSAANGTTEQRADTEVGQTNEGIVEMAAFNSRDIKNITCCTAIGWKGFMTLIALYILGSLQLYLAYHYTVRFKSFHRWECFIFLGFALIYFSMTTWVAIRWRSYVKLYIKDEKKNIEHKITSIRGGRRSMKMALGKLQQYREKHQITGPYFLRKFYLWEFIEKLTVLTNVFSLYLCALPSAIIAIFCFLQIVETFMQLRKMQSDASSKRRDNQIVMDTVIDAIDTIVPILLIWMVYRINIPIKDLLQVIVWASMTMLTKLRMIYFEIIRSHTTRDLVFESNPSIRAKELERTGSGKFNFKSKRQWSVYSSLGKMSRLQEKNVPVYVKRGLLTFGVLYCLLMLVVGCMSVFADGIGQGKCDRSDEMEFIWDSCTVRTPMCGGVWRVFDPQCNCAIIEIDHHNLTHLPSQMDRMSALRRVTITNGPLKELSDEFGINAMRLSVIEIRFNKLEKLPESVSTMKALHTVLLDFNSISAVPEALWQTSKELYALSLSSNNLRDSVLDGVSINLPSLHFLLLANNSLSRLPPSFQAEYCPLLRVLGIAGNNFTTLPKHIGSFSRTLVQLYMGQNNVSSFPDGFDALAELNVLDMRNNSFSKLPGWFENMGVLSGTFTAYGNRMCTNGYLNELAKDGRIRNALVNEPNGCHNQCSDFCLESLMRKNGMCDNSCFSESCEYDDGDCD